MSNMSELSQLRFHIANIEQQLQRVIATSREPDVACSIAGASVNKFAISAERIYKRRRKRDKIFGIGIFGEPAWDILLDLCVQSERGKQVSITSACIASGVAPTTALRWLSVLEANGIIVRNDDEHDARRCNVSLSKLGWKLMYDYLNNA